MSGITDAPFRRQATAYGAPYVVSEMAASEAFLERRLDVVRRTQPHAGATPWIVQIVGRCPGSMQAAARELARSGVDLIDINMGCPARKVTKGLSGSALMREPDLAKEIIHAVAEGAGRVPVSLKMRLGWDEHLMNAPELGQTAQAAGVIHLTIHGRTRCQFYKGRADWRRIRDTVEAVHIPVIANGDIASAKDAKRALALSGAAGVMIGRAALGQPWRVAEIEAALQGRVYTPPDLATRLEGLIQHIQDSLDLYGASMGLRIARKHIAAHLASDLTHIAPALWRAAQKELCRLEEPSEVLAGLKRLYKSSHTCRIAA